MSLYSVNVALQAASGVWIADPREEMEIKDALARGDVIIVEVAAVTESVTIHSLSSADFATFSSLSAWSAFQCSGRKTPFNSVFYRVDVEPVQASGEALLVSAPMLIPHFSAGIGADPMSGNSEDTDNGAAGGPEQVREPRPSRGYGR